MQSPKTKFTRFYDAAMGYLHTKKVDKKAIQIFRNMKKFNSWQKRNALIKVKYLVGARNELIKDD